MLLPESHRSTCWSLGAADASGAAVGAADTGGEAA